MVNRAFVAWGVPAGRHFVWCVCFFVAAALRGNDLCVSGPEISAAAMSERAFFGRLEKWESGKSTIVVFRYKRVFENESRYLERFSSAVGRETMRMGVIWAYGHDGANRLK